MPVERGHSPYGWRDEIDDLGHDMSDCIDQEDEVHAEYIFEDEGAELDDED